MGAWVAANTPPVWPITESLSAGRAAEEPAHPSHVAAVARLGVLARELGAAARLDRYFTGVSDAVVLQVGSGPVFLLAARNRYERGLYDDAVTFAAKVDLREPEGPAARLLVAAAEVQRRSSVRAVQALQQVLARLDEAGPSRERAWHREIALLSIARVFGASAVRLDENDSPVVSESHLSAAVKFYERVEPTSPPFADAARELAWLFWLAGDHAHARGLGRWLSSPASTSPYAVDGDVIRAASALAHCDFDGARLAVAQLRSRASALHAWLSALDARAKRDDDWFALLAAAREGRMDPAAAIAIAHVGADRGTVRQLEYLARLDAEARAAGPGALAEERARVIGGIAQVVRERVRDTLANLAARLEDGRRIEAATTSPQAVEGAFVDAPEARSQELRPRDRELDPWTPRLPFVAARYESQLFHAPGRHPCAR